jgi:7-carboxy-7-deazaguanine synthase
LGKEVVVNQEKLYICEIFESIQGETSLAGTPTTFIRVAGCPLRCTWCDTTYAYAQGEMMSLSDIVDKVLLYKWLNVCVTGGEPLFQSSTISLLKTLLQHGHAVSLETSGAFSIADIPPGVKIILDVKCPASGMSDAMDRTNFSRITHDDEVKFVIANRSDYDYAKNLSLAHDFFSKTPNVLISPVHGLVEPKEIVAWILTDRLPFRLNLQLHKYVWDINSRGV